MSWTSPEFRKMKDEHQLIIFNFHCRDSSGVHVLEFKHYFPLSRIEHLPGTPEYWNFLRSSVDPMQDHMDDCLVHSARTCHVCADRSASRVLLATKFILHEQIPIIKNLTSVVCQSAECEHKAKGLMTAASQRLEKHLISLELALWPEIEFPLPLKIEANGTNSCPSLSKGRCGPEMMHTRSVSSDSGTYELVSNRPPTIAQPQLMNFQPRRLSPIRSSFYGANEAQRKIRTELDLKTEEDKDQHTSTTTVPRNSLVNSERPSNSTPKKSVSDEDDDYVDDEEGTINSRSSSRMFTLVPESTSAWQSTQALSAVSRDFKQGSRSRVGQINSATPPRLFHNANHTAQGSWKSNIQLYARDRTFVAESNSEHGIKVYGTTRSRSPATASQNTQEGDSVSETIRINGFLNPYKDQSGCITVKKTVSVNSTKKVIDGPPTVPEKTIQERPGTMCARSNDNLQPPYSQALVPPQSSNSSRNSRSIDILAALREIPPVKHTYSLPGNAIDIDEDQYQRKWIATTRSADFRPVSALSLRPARTASYGPPPSSSNISQDFHDTRCQSAQSQYIHHHQHHVKQSAGRLRRAAEKIGIRKTKSIDCFGGNSGLPEWFRTAGSSTGSRLSRCEEVEGCGVVKTDRRAGAYDGPDE